MPICNWKTEDDDELKKERNQDKSGKRSLSLDFLGVQICENIMQSHDALAVSAPTKEKNGSEIFGKRSWSRGLFGVQSCEKNIQSLDTLVLGAPTKSNFSYFLFVSFLFQNKNWSR